MISRVNEGKCGQRNLKEDAVCAGDADDDDDAADEVEGADEADEADDADDAEERDSAHHVCADADKTVVENNTDENDKRGAEANREVARLLDGKHAADDHD